MHTWNPTGALTILVEAVPSADYPNSSVSLEMGTEVWSRINERVSAERIVVGWYHSHPNLGAYFSGTDRRTQRAFFNNHYSLGWVIDPFRDERRCFLVETQKSIGILYWRWIMGWRWRKVINFGGGFRANMSRSGVGWSWGIPGLRIGKGSDGSTWVSVGIPGTGLYFTKRLTGRTSQMLPHPKQDPDQETPSHQPGIKAWKDLKR